MDFYIRRRDQIIFEYNQLKKSFEPEKFVEKIIKIHHAMEQGPLQYSNEILHFIQPQREIVHQNPLALSNIHMTDNSCVMGNSSERNYKSQVNNSFTFMQN